MTDPITIRMGGYGPPTTSFSKRLKLIGDTLVAAFGDRVDVKYVWNIMDFGYRAEEILWLVEDGVLTLGYQSSSYLTDRVGELGFVDLPFLFERRDDARTAIDGALGRFLAEKIEQRVNYRILGWFENGFRHISNRAAARARARRSQRHAHPRVAERGPGQDIRTARRRSGALRSDRGDRRHQGRYARRAGKPVRQYGDLRRAQVSSLSHRDEPLLHLAADFLASTDVRRLAGRPAGRHARSVSRAVAFQRELAIAEDREARAAIVAEGCEITELTADEHAQFRAAVAPLLDEARKTYGQRDVRLDWRLIDQRSALRWLSGLARISDQNTLYFDFGV